MSEIQKKIYRSKSAFEEGDCCFDRSKRSNGSFYGTVQTWKLFLGHPAQSSFLPI